MVTDDFQGSWHGVIFRAKLFEKVFAGGARKNTRIWHANHVNNQLDLLSFVCAWKEGKAREKFNEDASEGPHVDLLGVGEESEHDIRRAIKPTLNVSVHNFIFQTPAAKISNCNPRFVLLLHKDILRFQIAMNDAQLFQVAQSAKQLDRETPN